MLRRILAAAALLIIASGAQAETISVKYYGSLDLAPFVCTDVARSSFVNRVCFDEARSFMVISLNGTYYPYCAIGAGTVASLLSAPSMGRYYNSFIRSQGSVRGPFDCRDHPPPQY